MRGDEYSRLMHFAPWGQVVGSVRNDHYEADRQLFKSVIVEDEYFLRDVPCPIETVCDIGANLGFFSVLVRSRHGSAKIVAVEVDPANLRGLAENVAHLGIVVMGGACTYEKPPLVVRSTIYRGTHNTGGSAVIYPGEPDQAEHGRQPRWPIFPENIWTLERVLADAGMDRLDLLKLDAEGSEHSILRNCDQRTLQGIGLIVGEWHGWEEWLKTVSRFDADRWDLDFLSEQGRRFGRFRLSQRAWVRNWQTREEVYANDIAKAAKDSRDGRRDH